MPGVRTHLYSIQSRPEASAGGGVVVFIKSHINPRFRGLSLQDYSKCGGGSSIFSSFRTARRVSQEGRGGEHMMMNLLII